ncbi:MULTISPECIES: RHS repeat-associated core domain-containing protein [Cysteiniphilum]|uniref:RHS repeat-associated core domain-containing protein n=1 Tax=Cysteiniphilum TaxID=2056696 RepID=UPI00177DADA5|nr:MULTISPECIES: RHS repeat-associated core domain-containing protein [Cysteiniphilum]
MLKRSIISISWCSMLMVGFGASVPKVNMPTTAKQLIIKPTTNIVTYNYADDTPLKLTGYSNSVGAYNESLVALQYNAQNEIVSDDHANQLSYDALGEMIEFDHQQTQQKVQYQYDVEDHQSLETIFNNQGKVTASQQFYYSTGDQAQMLAESDSGGNQLSYLFAEEKIGSLNNSNEADLYITDQAGSVVALASNSQLSHEYVYSPYGIDNDLDQSTAKVKNAQGFDGQRTDQATGYQFLGNGYRAYNPILHRFMQMDDIRYSPFGKGGINGYVFANNNPVMNFDPSGHSAWGVFNFAANVVLAVVGGIAEFLTLGMGSACGTAILGITFGVTGAVVSQITSSTKTSMIVSSLLAGVSLIADIASLYIGSSKVYSSFTKLIGSEDRKVVTVYDEELLSDSDNKVLSNRDVNQANHEAKDLKRVTFRLDKNSTYEYRAEEPVKKSNIQSNQGINDTNKKYNILDTSLDSGDVNYGDENYGNLSICKKKGPGENHYL